MFRETFNALGRLIHGLTAAGIVLGFAWLAPQTARAADVGTRFASPEQAVAALVAAASASDTNALRVIFGPASATIQNPDQVQAGNELRAFNEACGETQRVVHVSEARCVLEVGHNAWPFPVPLVKEDGQWFFDTEAGRDEILSRRIGMNELATLEVVRTYVDAQREYAAKDRDGDEVLEYAQHFMSLPGLKDGLHWPRDLDGEISPLGPLIAQAQAQGYTRRLREQGGKPEPFHGYFFRILTRQAASAPGGRYDYIINGNMIGGFALIAWPAEYGESGIMTFLVSHHGRVYQKDLGPKTGKVAEKLKAYHPDASWVLSAD